MRRFLQGAIEAFRRRRAPAAKANALDPVAMREQTALLRAVEALGGELDPERVLPQLVDQLAELLRADTADYYVYEPNRRTLRCVAVHGLPGKLVGFEVDAVATLAADAIAGGRPVASSNPPVPHPAYESLAGAIVAPLIGADGVSGVLGVGRRQGSSPRRTRTSSARSRASPRSRSGMPRPSPSARGRRACSAASTGSPRFSASRSRSKQRWMRSRRQPRRRSVARRRPC